MPSTGAPRRRGGSGGAAERKAFRKQPTQARAQATVEAILSAARRVLTRTGYAKFSTNRVAKTAGVSIGSLYQYFPNKRALVGAVLEDHVERRTRELLRERRKLVQMSVEQLIHRYAEWMVESHLDDLELHRILVEELPRHGLTPKISADIERAIVSIRVYLEAHASELYPRDHGLSAFIIIHTMESLTKAALARDPGMLNAELVDAIATLITGYLKPGAG